MSGRHQVTQETKTKTTNSMLMKAKTAAQQALKKHQMDKMKKIMKKKKKKRKKRHQCQIKN